MKTSDVLKTGIDRNFLRKCIDEGIITPHKQDSDTIIHKQYIPQEYSQEDVETVWNAYLYRKLGLSYDQIKKLKEGQEISLRSSLNSLIKKYEAEIEELQALVKFMRYVKAIGFVPNPPKEMMGSSKFKDYLSDFINYFDREGKIQKSISVIEFFSDVEDFDKLDEADISTQASIVSSIYPHFTDEDNRKYAEAFSKLYDNINEDPASEQVQTIICDLYSYHKKLTQDPSITPWSFAINLLTAFAYDSDISFVYKKMLGEELCNYFISSLIEFLKIQEPEKVKELFGKKKGNSHG